MLNPCWESDVFLAIKHRKEQKMRTEKQQNIMEVYLTSDYPVNRFSIESMFWWIEKLEEYLPDFTFIPFVSEYKFCYLRCKELEISIFHQESLVALVYMNEHHERKSHDCIR